MTRLTAKVRRQRRSGVVFITALGITLILSALLLAFAQNMRTEAMTAANRLSDAQADAVEQGAEQWVLATCEQYQTDAWSITQTPGEAIPVGSGYFWILRPNQESDQQFDFGIEDESGKINLNAATSQQLQTLPNMTPQIADAMLDWRNPAGARLGDGAQSDYYLSLPEPYSCKNAPYETVEELLMVKGVTPQILYGYDLKRSGVIDAADQAASGGLAAAFNGSGDSSRGIFNFVTCYTVQPGPGRRTAVGLININTASETVLMSLPGLQQSDADAIIAARQAAGNGLSGVSALQQILTPAKYAGILGMVTTSSLQYSADIVAVSGDGRSFRRDRIVVDVSQIPAKIVYRKDLTSLGWPLDPAIRQALRSGQGIQAGSTTPSAIGE